MSTWKFRWSKHDHNSNYKSRVHRNYALRSLDYPGYIRSEYLKEILTTQAIYELQKEVGPQEELKTKKQVHEPISAHLTDKKPCMCGGDC